MRIPRQSAHTSVRYALGVIVEIDEILVVLIHRQPCRIIVFLGHLALHRGDNAQSAARDGGVANAGMLVVVDKADGLCHFVGRHMVEVGHESAGVGAYILFATPPFQNSLAYDTWARLLNTGH